MVSSEDTERWILNLTETLKNSEKHINKIIISQKKRLVYLKSMPANRIAKYLHVRQEGRRKSINSSTKIGQELNP
jgi:hypothetical protein